MIKVWRGADGFLLDFGDGRTQAISLDEARELGELLKQQLSPQKHHWRPAEEAELRRLYAAGEPIWAIAKALGRQKTAISNKIARLGIAHRNPLVQAMDRARAKARRQAAE